MLSIHPARINPEQQVPHAKDHSESCRVSAAAIYAIRFLGLALIAAGIGCILAASQLILPIALLVAGAAASVLGFTLKASEETTVPLQDAPPLSARMGNDSPAQFDGIDSSKLRRITAPLSKRSDFLEAGWETPPPIIGKSPFVSFEMARHLMVDKKNLALGVKYAAGDKITNMEGALHTFVTPVGPIAMTGDFQWLGRLVGNHFAGNQIRPMILSAAIHPDFEFDNVILPVVKLGVQPVEGASLSEEAMDRELHAVNRSDNNSRDAYEMQLRRHMVYHLTQNHSLPSLDQVEQAGPFFHSDYAKFILEGAIRNESGKYLSQTLQGKYVRVATPSGESVLSLEALLNLYIEQVRNEFKMLNPNTPQGYVYTICPPAIFSRYVGDAVLLNRLQAMAFKCLLATEPDLFSNLRVLAFNDYSDRDMVDLYKMVFQGTDVQAQSLASLYSGLNYNGPKGLALVVHNNSDAFGQNIEFEGPSSMDGMIGSFTDAACLLQRDRPDLLSCVV